MASDKEEAFAYLELIPETKTVQIEVVKEDTGMDIAGPLCMPFLMRTRYLKGKRRSS